MSYGQIRLWIHIVDVIPDWESNVWAELDSEVHIHPLVRVKEWEGLIINEAIVLNSDGVA